MSTSGVAVWTADTNDIITQAAKQLGKLGEGDNVTSEEYNDMLWRLNAMIKQWIAKNDYAPGLKTWLRAQGYMFLDASTGNYNLGSAGGITPSYWTNNYQFTSVSTNNSIGATTINIDTVTAMNQSPQASTGSGLVSSGNTGSGVTVPLLVGMYVGIQLDNGGLFWTKVLTINNGANTFTIPAPGLPSASTNTANMIFAFATIAPPPQVIEYAVLRDAQFNDTPISIINAQDYMGLAAKQAPGYVGDPVAIYPEYHLVGNNGQGFTMVQTDVAGAQDVSKVILLKYVYEIEDFVNPTDEMCFPKQWAMALMLGLAKHCAPMFNAQWSQTDERMTQDAIRFARNAYNKTSTTGFSIASRGGEQQIQWR